MPRSRHELESSQKTEAKSLLSSATAQSEREKDDREEKLAVVKNVMEGQPKKKNKKAAAELRGGAGGGETAVSAKSFIRIFPKISFPSFPSLLSLPALPALPFGRNGKKWQETLEQKKTQSLTAKNGGKPVPVTPAVPTTPPVKKKLTWWRILFFPILNPIARIVLLALFLAGFLGILYVLRDLPSPTLLGSGTNFAVSSQIFDRNGKLLYEIFGNENRIPIKINTLPPYVYQASVSIEDKNFYHHFGIDIFGVVRAIRDTVTGNRLEGGSTITQQLVKNALLTRERSLNRKFKEAVLAVATELLYSKEQILEMYLNYISYGGTSVGIEAASKQYFNKSAKDLDLAEAAMLAGLPQSPTTYSPYGSNPEAAKQRQQDVLRRMVEDKYITQAQADAASKEVLHFAISRTDIKAPHFVFYVRDLLYQKYGVDRVEKGGLRVYTSLDLDLQNVAQASVAAEVAKLQSARVSNGAAMVLKPNTGEILAMVGSKDYFDTKEDGQVNVALATRQPGSSIKPIMYATTFQEKTLNPGTNLLDIPTCFNVPGQKPYCPRNYDGNFHGQVSIRTSLGNSFNIPAVKALSTIGVTTFIKQATQMGITTWTNPANYGLSITLGGGEVRMIDLAQAFSTLADQGVKVPLTPILRVEDYKGNLIDSIDTDARQQDLQTLTDDESQTAQGEVSRVMNRAPAYMVAHIMQDNNARIAEFGPHSKLVIPNQVVSAKTGTTNDLKDNWTVGFTPHYLVIVWVGNNDGTPMNQALVSGITGAAPIWNDIMSYVLKDQKPLWEEKPDDVTTGDVCVSGFPAGQYGTAGQPASPASPTPGTPGQPDQGLGTPGQDQGCGPTQHELYWTKSQPSNSKYISEDIWVDPTTGLPAKPGVTDGLVAQHRVILSDPLTGGYCFDCTRPVGPDGKVIYETQNVNSDSVNSSDVQSQSGTAGQ